MQLQRDETALDVLLRSIDCGFRTNIPFLDEMIYVSRVSRNGDETEIGYKPRQVTQLFAEHLFPTTTLLYHIVAAFLLENGKQNLKSINSHKQVYIFDHEYECRAETLQEILMQMIAFGGDRLKIAQALMGQVIVYRCHSTFEWIATVNSLYFDLMEKPNARNHNILLLDGLPLICYTAVAVLLILHRINSFDDIDKHLTQQFGNGVALTEQLHLLLKDFIQCHTPTVIASAEVTFRKSSWDPIETFSPAWTSQIHRRIHFRRDLSSEGVWYTSKSMAQRRSGSYHFQISDKNMIVNLRNTHVSVSATPKRPSSDTTLSNRS